MKQMQVTLLCKSGKYKPVSTVVKVKDNATDKEIRSAGIKKILIAKGWTIRDLKTLDYVQYKTREYNKVEIDHINKERYEKIKQEKYACGEWKAPKRKEKA